MKCGKCLNCRNHFPALCLSGRRDGEPARRSVRPGTRREPAARNCGDCGAPQWGKKRFCSACAKRRRKAQTREAVRKHRHVSKNRNLTLENIGRNRAIFGGLDDRAKTAEFSRQRACMAIRATGT